MDFDFYFITDNNRINILFSYKYSYVKKVSHLLTKVCEIPF